MLGPDAGTARTLSELSRRVPSGARRALEGVEDPDDLWEAEARWWARLDREGAALARRPIPGRPSIVGATALLAVDAWRVRAALERAARGGGSTEVLHAVA